MRQPPPRRRPTPKPLADFIETCLSASLAAQGFATSDIIVAWPDVVGERLAEFTQPLKIEWKRKGPNADPEARPEPATLVVRVESAFALELQHLAPLVIERVNSHYGWRCVGKLVLKQGPVRREHPKKRVEPAVGEADRQRIGDATAPIDEDDLKAALTRLGTAIIGTEKGPPTKA